MFFFGMQQKFRVMSEIVFIENTSKTKLNILFTALKNSTLANARSEMNLVEKEVFTNIKVKR